MQVQLYYRVPRLLRALRSLLPQLRLCSKNKKIFFYKRLAPRHTHIDRIFIRYLSLGGSSGLVTGVALAKRAASAAAASSFLRLSSSSRSCSRRFNSFNSNCKI